MNERDKEIQTQIYIEKLCSLLNGTASSTTVVNSRGEVGTRLVIQYKE